MASNVYIAIDLKSYYASVECVQRHQNPLTFNLLVADESRTDKTICLAVSPSLKAMGVGARPRLFEAKEAIRLYEAQHHCKVSYVIAPPQMALYEKVSAQIYSIYLKYVSTEDIHVYSIDEVFIDATHYMNLYRPQAEAAGTSPPHYLAMTMIRDVLQNTGITATAGIGTNLYLAKVDMDIVAKKAPADADGVQGPDLMQRFQIKIILFTAAPCLTDERMLLLRRQRGQLLRPSDALHPQRLPSAAAHAHHQRTRRRIAESHGKQRSRGQHGAHALHCCIGLQPVQKPFRQRLAAHKIEQKTVVVIENMDILPRQFLRFIFAQHGKGIVHPSAENRMHHQLMVARIVHKVLAHHALMCRQTSSGFQLSAQVPRRVARRIVIHAQISQRLMQSL